MMNILRRPSTFDSGTVSSVPINPPRLNTLAASAFQPSDSWVASTRLNPIDAWAARPAATTGRKALQLHQVISATVAISRPLTVVDRYSGEKRSAIVGALA